MKPDYRTTLGAFFSQDYCYVPGIYVIACYPSLGVLYIGISNDVHRRLREHLASDEPLAQFIRDNFADACGWRLDIFSVDDPEKRMDIEKKLVQYFRPTYNMQHLGEQLPDMLYLPIEKVTEQMRLF
jgi:predicted GIY-YIG superfamily endonuclease